MSSLLMASTMVSFNNFAYICSVILVDECPHTLDTIPMFIPLFNSKVAPVCLAQCEDIGLSILAA
jgi:hypothetical protein